MSSPFLLFRKPRSFDEVLCQGRAVDELRRRVQKNRHLPNLILHGPNGVGKKTLARLYAEAALCEGPSPEGIPCRSCATCGSLRDGGLSLGLIWVEGGARNLPDDLRKHARAGAYGERCMTIVTNAEKMSAEGYDQLLKVFEQSGTTFVLITEDPQRIRTAIRSRCIAYRMRKLEVSKARGVMRAALTSRHIEADSQVLNVLVALSKGRPGEMLRLLDRLAPDSELALSAVRKLFGLEWPIELATEWSSILRADIGGWEPPESQRRVVTTELARRIRALLAHAINELQNDADSNLETTGDAAVLHLDRTMTGSFEKELRNAAAERGLHPQQLVRHLAWFWSVYVPPVLVDPPPASPT